ncbi:hypothetical protein TIFTF001_006950 [Ficus carica]|uniref:Uncharacterized protein n=1 Tax=Ficus carica TaxID=3494 RepID=A0AA87ZNZ4_FICCA|nr:hypothetical protein TIFTF001_006950 [Ficus carica]
MGMANEGIPTERGVQIDEIPQVVLANGNPGEENHDAFEVEDVLSSPIYAAAATSTSHVLGF